MQEIYTAHLFFQKFPAMCYHRIKLSIFRHKLTDSLGGTYMWIAAAVLSAFFAGITSILAKCGIRKTDSDVATALRTIVVVIFSWIMVFIVGSADQITEISSGSFLFLILSGLATGASWLCYYYAIQNGIVSVVVPIDKLSILVSIAFSYFVFREKLTKKSFCGLGLMVAGTLLMAIFA